MNGDKLTVGELVYKISGDMANLEVELKRANTKINDLKDAMKKGTTATSKMQKGFGALGAAVKTFIAGFVFDRVFGFLSQSISMAQERLELETALAQTLRVSRNATDEQIASLNKQAQALEKVGVVEASTITALQTRLAGFDLSAEAIAKLTPAILDYTVAERGANVSRQDAESRANGLAQALQGNFSSLSRVGFVLDDTTKKMISTGTEMERVDGIVQVLNSTYEGMNETLGKTFAGTVARTRAAIGNLRESIGFALMPAVSVLAQELLGVSEDMGSTLESTNGLAKGLYRIANVVVAVSASFKSLLATVRIAWNGIQAAFDAGAIAIVKGAQIIARVTKQNTDWLDSLMTELKNNMQTNADDISDAWDSMKTATDQFNASMSEAIDPQNFKAATEADIAALRSMGNATDAFGASSEDAAEKLEKFTDGIQKAAVASIETRKAIEGDLKKATDEFGKSVGENLTDTGEKLAEIVVNAQSKAQELKKKLLEDNITDQGQIKDLTDQLAEQEAIIKSSADFQTRQAERVAEIKKQLTDAGIDLEKSGLDAALKTSDFKTQLAEQERLATLNEFQLFEEQQAKKLEKLASDYIAEVALLREKYDQQIKYEADITKFMESEDAKRLASTNAWAVATIQKYKEVADSIKNLLPSSDILKNFSNVGGISPISPSRVNATTTDAVQKSGGNTTNNTTSINAPVTINGQNIQGLTAQEISAILGFELNKYIR